MDALQQVNLTDVDAIATSLTTKGPDWLITNLYTFRDKWVHSDLIHTEDLGLCCVDLQIKIPKGNTVVTEAEISMDPLCHTESTSFGSKGRVGVPWKLTLKQTTSDGQIIRTNVLVKSTLDPEISPIKDYGRVPPSKPEAVFNNLNKDQGPCIRCWLPADFDRWRYLALDEFTNETIIAGVISDIWHKHALKYNKGTTFPFVQHYQASICGQTKQIKDKPEGIYQILPGSMQSSNIPNNNTYTNLGKSHYGVNMMELCDMGNLRDYGQATDQTLTKSMHEIWNQDRSKDEEYLRLANMIKDMKGYFGSGSAPDVPEPIVRRVILQKKPLLTIWFHVISAIDILSQLAFFQQGDLKVANVFLKQEQSTLIHRGITCVSNFTAKVADFGKSSINCSTPNSGTVRLFKHDALSVTYLSKFPFHANIKTLDNDIDVYSIDNTTDFQTYTRTRYMGIPFYSSFDAYMFTVSMMLQPCFYYSMMANRDVFAAIWEDGFWIHCPEDGRTALARIKKIIDSKDVKKQVSTGALIGVLSKLNLACDVYTQVFESLTASFHNI
jgi:hypothetical protein